MSDADYLTAPYENDATNNDVSTVKFAATTDSAANAIPRKWHGKHVKLTAVGGNLHFFFSLDSGAECDRTVSATAAGATGATVGDYLANGSSDHVFVPNAPPGTDVYFVREADATTVVYARKAQP